MKYQLMSEDTVEKYNKLISELALEGWYPVGSVSTLLYETGVIQYTIQMCKI